MSSLRRAATSQEFQEDPPEFLPDSRPATALPRLHDAGSRLLEAFLGDCVRALPAVDRGTLAAYVSARSEASTIATACSGTDSPLLAVAGVQAALESAVHASWNASHEFSCEADSRKRRFITAFHEPKALFGDCTQLGNEAFCFQRKAVVPVRGAEWYIAGFPCKDVSAYCNQCRQHRESIGSGNMIASPQTGKAFEEGVLGYIRKHGSALQSVILENVMGLAAGKHPTPLSMCLARLEEAGIHATAFALSPTDFGFSVPRPRIWIHGVPTHRLKGMSPDVVDEILQSTVDLCSRVGCDQHHLSFEQTLLEDTHPRIRKLIAECQKLPMVENCAPKRARLASSSSGQKPWQQRHLEHLRSNGIEDWYHNPIPSPELQTLLPCLRQLNAREFDILMYKHDCSYPEKKRRVLRLNTSIHFAGGTAGTLTPSSRHYVTDKCRLVTGTEMLCQQGIVFPRMERLSAFEENFLGDLAGNAFHVWVASVMVLASIRVAALCERVAAIVPPGSDAILLAAPEEEAEDVDPLSLDFSIDSRSTWTVMDALWS